MREAFELSDHAVQLSDQRSRAGRAERLDQRAIIPERAFLATLEAAPERFDDLPVISQDFPGVVQLIRGGDQVHLDRKSTRLNSSHIQKSRMPSSA